jgi:aminoglycoside 2'-N-acetyltransferase I
VLGTELLHTALVDGPTRREIRGFLDEAFGGEFGDDDWENALGGLHVVLRDGGELVGHASVVQRRLVHDGRALRTGYVEAVAVRPDRRRGVEGQRLLGGREGAELVRRGVGSALMLSVERAVTAAYELGALSATEEALPFYAARGWQRWSGPTGTFGPAGVRLTPEEDGGVHLLPVGVRLDPGLPLLCDWRNGDCW